MKYPKIYALRLGVFKVFVHGVFFALACALVYFLPLLLLWCLKTLDLTSVAYSTDTWSAACALILFSFFGLILAFQMCQE